MDRFVGIAFIVYPSYRFIIGFFFWRNQSARISSSVCVAMQTINHKLHTNNVKSTGERQISANLLRIANRESRIVRR